jgi:hypothetical protein
MDGREVKLEQVFKILLIKGEVYNVNPRVWKFDSRNRRGRCE